MTMTNTAVHIGADEKVSTRHGEWSGVSSVSVTFTGTGWEQTEVSFFGTLTQLRDVAEKLSGAVGALEVDVIERHATNLTDVIGTDHRAICYDDEGVVDCVCGLEPT